VHGADVQPGPGRERRDCDLAFCGDESLDQVERTVDGLH
jgi:hypothetical protein